MDADFLKRANIVSANADVALAIRRVLAHWCGIEESAINPEQRTEVLHEKMKSGWSRGWDEMGFIMKLEEELHCIISKRIQIPPFTAGRFIFWSIQGPSNVGEWIRKTAEVLHGSLNGAA
jgi:hypothetical protein